MTRETQVGVYEYEEPLDYGPWEELLEIIWSEMPDYVVNLGDFTEPYYEDAPTHTPLAIDLLACKRIRYIKLLGNHDRTDGLDNVMLDGYRYEHGHKLAQYGSQEYDHKEYVAALRENTKGMRVIHGHTHYPKLTKFGDVTTLDVGSVTFSRTFGRINDGVPIIGHLKG